LTWHENNNTDDEEYSDDVDDSENPIIPHDASLQEIDNALDRNEDDLPDNVDN
jgi:hypothetical protein